MLSSSSAGVAEGHGRATSRLSGSGNDRVSVKGEKLVQHHSLFQSRARRAMQCARVDGGGERLAS